MTVSVIATHTLLITASVMFVFHNQRHMHAEQLGS